MPRVVRKHSPTKVYKEWNYRESLPLLLSDFSERCAYSLVHKKCIADGEMHVDHFDPTKKRASKYENLFPAYAPCNMAKSDTWPVAAEVRQGIRFLNPCVEKDYNHQIFEHPSTFELIGTTPAAIYHIEVLDLNNGSLVTMRRKRAHCAKILELQILEGTPEKEKLAEQLKEDLRFDIPPILPPPLTEAPS